MPLIALHQTYTKLRTMALATNTIRVKSALFILLAIFSLIYMVSVNFLSTQGFRIKRLQQEVGEAKKTNLESSFSLDRQSSEGVVMAKALGLGLERPKQLEYITLSGKNVAFSR